MNINMNEIENLKNEMCKLKEKITNDFIQIIAEDDFEELKSGYEDLEIDYGQDVNNFRIKSNVVDLVVSGAGVNIVMQDLEKIYRDCLHKIFNKQVSEIVSIDRVKEIGREIGYKFVGTLEECWKYCEDNELVSVCGYPVDAFKKSDTTKIEGKKFYADENYKPWYCVK